MNIVKYQVIIRCATKKIKAAVKNKTGATLRMSLKMFAEDKLPHELLLTTRQKRKLRNV